MAVEYDVKAFQALVREAIGNRTQSEFARESGLTPQYLNRLLNSDDIGRPTKSTLMKLSGHSYSGIPLSRFLEVCEYDDAGETLKQELRSMPLNKRIKKSVDTIIEGFNKLSENRPIYNSLYDFTDTVLMIYDEEDTSVSIGEPFDLVKGEFGSAEKAAIATISWGDDYNISPKSNGFDVELDILICYSETKGDSVIICGIYTDQETLYQFESEVVRQLLQLDQFKSTGISCIIHKKLRSKKNTSGLSAEERLLYAIFGSVNETPTVIQKEGYGFYLDNTPLYVVKKFIENHKDSMSDTVKKNYEESLKNISDDVKEDENGYPNFAICAIMSKETGLNFAYSYEPELENEHQTLLFPEKHPWEYTDQEKELSKDSFIRILDKYARELRTEVEYCKFRYNGVDEHED